jgi:hypothetical protein
MLADLPPLIASQRAGQQEARRARIIAAGARCRTEPGSMRPDTALGSAISFAPVPAAAIR